MHATHLLQGEVSTTYVTLIKCLVKYPPRPTIDWQYVQPNAYYPHYCKDLTKPKTRLLLVVHFFVHTSHSRHDITQRTHLVCGPPKYNNEMLIKLSMETHIQIELPTFLYYILRPTSPSNVIVVLTISFILFLGYINVTT